MPTDTPYDELTDLEIAIYDIEENLLALTSVVENLVSVTENIPISLESKIEGEIDSLYYDIVTHITDQDILLSNQITQVTDRINADIYDALVSTHQDILDSTRTLTTHIDTIQDAIIESVENNASAVINYIYTSIHNAIMEIKAFNEEIKTNIKSYMAVLQGEIKEVISNTIEGINSNINRVKTEVHNEMITMENILEGSLEDMRIALAGGLGSMIKSVISDIAGLPASIYQQTIGKFFIMEE